MPQVPTPTLPPGPSGLANILFFTIPPFFVFKAFALKFCHFVFSASRASSNSFNLTCFFCFFCFRYSRCFCNCSFLWRIRIKLEPQAVDGYDIYVYLVLSFSAKLLSDIPPSRPLGRSFSFPTVVMSELPNASNLIDTSPFSETPSMVQS